MADNIGFKDGRNLAERALAPAKPLSRTLAKFGSLKLDIGGKIKMPGVVSKVTDITAATRSRFGSILKTKAETQAFSGTLTSVLGEFDKTRKSLDGFVLPSPVTGNATGIPSTTGFLEFSNLKPGERIPTGFNSIIDDRKTQLAALQQRVSSIFATNVFKGVSISENFNKTPYPLDEQLDLPTIPPLAQGGLVAAKDSILKDKRKFAIVGVHIGAGKPSFWSRLLSLAQVKAIPSLNPVVNQVFKDRKNAGTWSEPVSPFAAQYPYNRVSQTESGHVMEFDDTPGAERVHIFHRSGSFIEWHPDGTVVYKNMKDGYDLTMGDKYIKVNGSCHIAVDGNATVYTKGNVDVQSDGDINFQAKKDFNVYAANVNLRAKKLFRGDGAKIDLRYISLPTSLIPIPMGAGFAPRVNLAAIKADFPRSNIVQVLQNMAKNPLDPKNANIDIKFNQETVALPKDNPLSNPGIYNKKTASAIAYRGRLFDAPEETEDIELYSAHIELQQSLGDVTGDPRIGGGKLYILEGPSITTEKVVPTVNYLNFDDFKGTFSYPSNFVLGGTSFRLIDLIDTAIYPDILPLPPVPLAPVDTFIPTITITDPRPSTTGGGSGGNGGGHNTSVRSYQNFVKGRWDELDGLPAKGDTEQERRENAAKFTRIIAWEINQGLNGAVKDSRCGLWQKRSDTTVQDRDADKIFFLMGNNVIEFSDIIAGAGDENPRPAWQPERGEGGEVTSSDPLQSQGWVAPQPEPGVHI